jgi:hypothetical protein
MTAGTNLQNKLIGLDRPLPRFFPYLKHTSPISPTGLEIGRRNVLLFQRRRMPAKGRQGERGIRRA